MGRVSVFDPLRDFIRRMVRKHTKPVTPDEAAEKREIFSIFYILSAFALFCKVSYDAYNASPKAAESPEGRLQDYLQRSDGEKGIKVIKLRGFDFANREEMEYSAEEVQRMKNNNKDRESSQ